MKRRNSDEGKLGNLVDSEGEMREGRVGKVREGKVGELWEIRGSKRSEGKRAESK